MSATRIRVLQFLSVDDLAGTELSTYHLADTMDKKRFDVHVAFLMGDGPISDMLSGSGIPVHHLLGRHGLAGAAGELFSLARSLHFDVVHLYGFKTSLIGRMVFKILAGPTYVIHGIRGMHVTQAVSTESFAARLALAVERLLSPFVDAYVANSRGAIRFLTERGIADEKMVWIPSGIDTRKWASVSREAKSVPQIVCVARFHPVKRHVDLLEALDRISRKEIAFRCVLVGDGRQLCEVKALADFKGLGTEITFAGAIDNENVRALLAESDIFVLPSAWEGLPRSVIEAMAVGLPVVGTDVGGINELVVDGETGWLVPLGDTEALAEALASLLLDRDARLRMGSRGRKRIELGFDIRVTTHQLEEFYQLAVERREELKSHK